MVLLVFGFLAATKLDFSSLLELISGINSFSIASAIMLTSLLFFLSSLRFWCLNSLFGVTDSFIKSHKVNILSLCYSQIAVPVFSQIFGRAKHGKPDGRMICAPVTIIEKMTSFSIMLAFGLAGAYGIVGTAFFGFDLITAIALETAVILVVAGWTFAFLLNQEQRRMVKQGMASLLSPKFLSAITLSLLMHLVILAIYLVLVMPMVQMTSPWMLIKGLCLVVLATAIPIGTGGWGVREISAVSIFTVIGLPAEIGLLTAILYGLVHLITLGIHFLLLSRIKLHQTASAEPVRKFDLSTFWPVAAICAMCLIPFQIRLPIMQSVITINLADPVIIIMGINALIYMQMTKTIAQSWKIKGMWVGLAYLLAMIVVGWLVGLIKFGSNEWATASRLIGTIILFCYLMAGMAMRRYLPGDYLEKFAIILGWAFIIGALGNVLLMPIYPALGDVYFNWALSFLSGFVGDRNAFAFMGLAIITLILFFRSDQGLSFFALATIGLIVALVIHSGSRSGWGGVAILALYFILMRKQNILTILLPATAFVCVIYFGLWLGSDNILVFGARNLNSNVFGITNLRWETWKTGVEFFLESPLFGGGLGAVKESGRNVVHNAFLWVLGEMGIVGVCLVLPMVFALCRYLFKDNPLRDRSRSMLLAFLIICGGFALVQDIVYQRVLWFALGILCALSPKEENLTRG